MRLIRFSKIEIKGKSNKFVKVYCLGGGFVEYRGVIGIWR